MQIKPGGGRAIEGCSVAQVGPVACNRETERLCMRPWRQDEWERLLSIRSMESVAKWLGDPVPWVTKDETISRIQTWAEAHEILRSGPQAAGAATPDSQRHSDRGTVGSRSVVTDPRWEAGTWPSLVWAIVPRAREGSESPEPAVHGAGVPVGSVSLALLPEVDLSLVESPNDLSLGAMPVVGNREMEVGWYLHPDSVGSGYAGEAAAAALSVGFGLDARRIWAVMWSHNTASAGVAGRAGMADLGDVVDGWYGTHEGPGSRMFCMEDPSL